MKDDKPAWKICSFSQYFNYKDKLLIGSLTKDLPISVKNSRLNFDTNLKQKKKEENYILLIILINWWTKTSFRIVETVENLESNKLDWKCEICRSDYD